MKRIKPRDPEKIKKFLVCLDEKVYEDLKKMSYIENCSLSYLVNCAVSKMAINYRKDLTMNDIIV